ncbi:MAG: GatB/YqeY domain-containing protein [Alphaproteobacteria bacterium]|nr:GatB/YqeY domain-containing protein [Alphaproteobacteria bacterium]
MLRQQLTESMKDAMRAKDDKALGTIRLILAKLKEKDIEARGAGKADPISDEQICAMMQGMMKQRHESIALYKQGNRPDLVAQEEAEIAVIERFLPAQMDDDAIKAAVEKAIAEVGASSIKDMGKVMGALKSGYAGQMDFAKAGVVVKGLLG